MERIEYPYLQDRDFLVKLDNQLSKKIHTKITLLQWDEKPIQEIQGYITGGSLTINGDSAIRRAGNLSVYLEDEKNAKITEVSNLYSINKKFYLEIGIENNTNQWLDYPILWFPQGVFVINGASASHSTSGTTLNLSFKDKMCLLSGDCGGTLSDTIEFHKYDTLTPEGAWVTEYPTLYQIILECVNHLGKEDMSRIFIADVDTRIKKVMKWTGNIPVYITNPDDPTVPSSITTTKPTSGIYREYEYGKDVGFVFTDFIWSNGELVSKPGDTIVSILDKIKNMLGNYEYFYDIWGNFHFQEKRNYLNISQATIVETVEDEENIIIDFDNMKYNVMDLAKIKAEYDFSESPLIINYSNNPAYNKIKNDYVVWGQRTGISGAKLPIRYHLAIDKKPQIGNTYTIALVKEGSTLKAKGLKEFNTRSDFPEIGSPIYFYLDKQSNIAYLWDAESDEPKYIEFGNLPINYDEVEYIANASVIRNAYQIFRQEELNLKLTASFGQNGRAFGIFSNTASQNYNITIVNKKIQINIGNKTINTNIETGENIKNVIEFYQKKENQEYKIQIKIDNKDFSSELKNVNWEYNEDAQFYIINNNSKMKFYNIIENNQNMWIPCIKKDNREVIGIMISNWGFLDIGLAPQPGTNIGEIIRLFKTITTTDWRTELYLQAIKNETYGLKDHDYAAELEAEWPKIYDLVNEKIYDKYLLHPEDLDYWLDFIDDAAISNISVNTIGRRTQSQQKDKVNCIFEPLIPDIVFIEAGQPDTETRRQECISRGQKYVQVDSALYNLFAQGGWLNSAYYEVQDMLYQGSSYNEAISLSTIPVYYLEPNTIINVFDKDSDIHGDYLIKSISIPLGVSGTSNISAQRALNKF